MDSDILVVETITQSELERVIDECDIFPIFVRVVNDSISH